MTSTQYSPSADPKPLEAVASHAHWFLRIALASVYVFHGVDKFMRWDMVTGMFQNMLGLGPAMTGAMTGMVATVEVVAGLGILAGGLVAGRAGDLVTRISALAMLPIILGAIFMVHWGQWAFMATESHPMGGMEFQVTLMLIMLYFLARGNR